MKTYIFNREFYCTVPGFEMDLYRSDDLVGSWSVWRACLEAALLDSTNLDPSVLAVLDEYALEELCLSKAIYCSIWDEENEPEAT